MIQTLWKNLAGLVSCVMVASLCAAMAEVAYGQETLPGASGPLIPPSPSASPERPTSDTLNSPEHGANDNDAPPPLDYWLVSSRRCPQGGRPCCTAEHLDYFHVGPDRQPNYSDLHAFRQSIRADVPVCIVIHGSYTSWQSLQNEGVSVFRWIRKAAPRQPLQVVFYSWPSEPLTTILPGLDIAILGPRASFNGFYLAKLIQQISDKTRVSFFGHSHGARVLASALHLLDGGQVNGYRLRSVGHGGRELRAVFAAAAIDHHWLNPGERFGRALNQIDHGLVFYNRRDLALTVYPLRRPFSHRALGLVGFDSRDRCLQHGRADKLAEIDVTLLVQRGHFWTRYFGRPQIAETMLPYLYFIDSTKRVGRTVVGEPRRSIDHTAGKRPADVIRHSSSTFECVVLKRRS